MPKKPRRPVYNTVVRTTTKVGHEVRKTIGGAIVAAFAFIIALVWQDVIRSTVDGLIAYLGLTGGGYVRLLAALITTLIAVGGIWYFSRWSEKQGQ
ncbi:Uncharacterised protein [uncultured archaeon]|nr:Uncharacterised protein [uncultured archaeon]